MSNGDQNTATKSLKEIVEKGPQFTRDSPLDQAFEDLQECVISKLNDAKSYRDLGFDDNKDFVSSLLGHFIKIYDAACDKQRVDHNELLPISLHDLRYLDTLITLIVLHGIQANLPASMRTEKCLDEVSFTIPAFYEMNPQTLGTVIDCFYPILTDKSKENKYMRSVLLRGPLYQAIFVGLLCFATDREDTRFEHMVDVLEKAQQTYELFRDYTSLIDRIRDPKVRSLLLTRLSSLPVRRDDGVLSLIDFVTGARENEQVDVEKISRVTDLLVAKPRSMSSVQYFTSLFRQVREQLSHINRPLVITCLNDLISTLHRKNSRIIQDFLFRPIFDVLYNLPIKNYSSKELNDVINMLISLTKLPSLDVIEALTSGHDRNAFYLHLWIYALFLRKFQTLDPIIYDNNGNKIEGNAQPYFNVILSIIKSYMVLTGHFEALNHLALNLINFEHHKWKYVIDLQTQLASISVKDETSQLPRELNTKPSDQNDAFDLFKDMDLAVDLFVTLLKLIGNEEVTKNLFLNVLSRWVKGSIEKENQNDLNENSSSALILIDLKILESMNKEFTSEIVRKPGDVLMLVLELMDSVPEGEKEKSGNGADSDDEDEESRNPATSPIFDTLLELLETVLDESTINSSSAVSQTLKGLYEKLERYETPKCQELRSNIDQILKNKIDTKGPAPTSYTDSKSLQEAMANLNDPIDPIKVQGLTTLARLAKDKSEVVHFAKFRAIFLQYLRYPDPYVYLNAIKGLAVLCESDPNSTIEALLGIYQNSDHKNKVDDILKIGEALTLYVQREGELFQGRQANNITHACLSMVRRRDSLDSRIRMSAISLIGVCLRVNAMGIQDTIPLILDCVFGILQLETPKNKNKNNDAFVVRRAAIHLVFDLLNSGGSHLLPQGYDHNRLVILLKYAQEHDEDSLVREHASEILSVMDNLSALQI